MTRGGTRQGAGRKPLPDAEKRQTLNCRVKSETAQWLNAERDRVDRSIGELVDLAVEVLQKHPDEQFPDAESGN